MESGLNSTGSLHPEAQPLYQTLAAPIVVGSSLLSPVLEGLGESEWGGIRGANQRRPCRVLYPNRELLIVADGKKIPKEGDTLRQVDRRGGGLLSHLIWQSKNTRNLESSHHTSSPSLRLLPVCPSLSTVGPQTHNLNDKWDGKTKASAFCMTWRQGKSPCSRSLTFSAPFPFITKLNLVMKEASEL